MNQPGILLNSSGPEKRRIGLYIIPTGVKRLNQFVAQIFPENPRSRRQDTGRGAAGGTSYRIRYPDTAIYPSRMKPLQMLSHAARAVVLGLAIAFVALYLWPQIAGEKTS